MDIVQGNKLNMACRIIKNKKSGEEFLIPGCFSVAHNWGIEGMTDREIIKAYCCCNRKRVEKYETHTRDEVIEMIQQLENKIERTKHELEKMENELDCVKSEVFMLNTVEVL